MRGLSRRFLEREKTNPQQVVLFGTVQMRCVMSL